MRRLLAADQLAAAAHRKLLTEGDFCRNLEFGEPLPARRHDRHAQDCRVAPRARRSARASGRYSYVCSIANPSLLAGPSASFFFVLGPRHDSKPDGVHRREEDEREDRAGERAADQRVRERSPEDRVRQWDEREDGSERGQDDGPRTLNRRFYDGVERSEALLQIVVDLSEEDDRVARAVAPGPEMPMA